MDCYRRYLERLWPREGGPYVNLSWCGYKLIKLPYPTDQEL